MQFLLPSSALRWLLAFSLAISCRGLCLASGIGCLQRAVVTAGVCTAVSPSIFIGHSSEPLCLMALSAGSQACDACSAQLCCCCLHCGGSQHLHWPFLPLSVPGHWHMTLASCSWLLLLSALQWLPAPSSPLCLQALSAESQACDACSAQLCCCCLHCGGSQHLQWPFLPWSVPGHWHMTLALCSGFLLLSALQWRPAPSSLLCLLKTGLSACVGWLPMQWHLLGCGTTCAWRSRLSACLGWLPRNSRLAVCKGCDACSVQLLLLVSALQWLPASSVAILALVCAWSLAHDV